MTARGRGGLNAGIAFAKKKRHSREAVAPDGAAVAGSVVVEAVGEDAVDAAHGDVGHIG
ncbi:MAG: hypothetical protein IT477_01475, partial [Rhodanobacteraceae bacterium]|nr:hypothetical protein [Rhodanobacteraceae bacterium]